MVISENDDVLALRQKVNKYLASVDEWTKLADKERESADALIAALLAENEKLRAFNAAFELWLEDAIKQEKSNEWNIKLGYDSIIVETLEDAQQQHNEFKAQHLDETETAK